MKGQKYNFERNAKTVAKELIGKTLESPDYIAQILETEGYEGGEQTPRRTCMLLAPGQIGIMPFRGLDFLNIGTERAGKPSCVLIRAVEIDGETYEGPGKVGKILDANSLEFQVVGKDIGLGGQTKPSTYTKSATKMSDNSTGRYKSK
jgi:3-methyladenine DNA glycosylase Mpg